MNNKVLITIPARSGSKRLPNKNLLSLCGKPLLYYSIKAALESGISNEIYIISDSQKILNIANEYGVKTFLLPEQLTDDTTGVVKASLYLLDKLESKGFNFIDLICLQPTSPLRSAEDVKQGYSQFKEDDAKSLVSVSEVDPHYFHWAIETSTDNKKSKLYFGEKFLRPRQDLPTMYFPNGALKMAKVDVLKKQGHFFGENMSIYLMPQERSIHIVTQVDFELCTILMKRKIEEKEGKKENEEKIEDKK